MIKKLQPPFYKQTVVYGLLFVFLGTLNYFFKSTPKGLNRIVFGVLSFTYIFLYLKNRKSVSGNKKDLAVWILTISGMFGIMVILYYLNINGRIIGYILAIYFLVLALVFIVRNLKDDFNTTLKGSLTLILLAYFLGMFKSSWWSIIPLVTAVIFLACSKEIIYIFSKKEISKVDIPYNLQKKWIYLRYFLILYSMILYLSFVTSDMLETKGWVINISHYFYGKNALASYSICLARGILRLVIVFISTLVLIFIAKVTPLKKVITSYKEIARKDEKDFELQNKKFKIQKKHAANTNNKFIKIHAPF
ncbi:hypothetical protein T481_07365 [Enterococcus faecalis PF3]|nr:hypothetical protein T481_07365 [Enterococcus faecalis PF3]